MENNEKVYVVSTVEGSTSINVPDLKLKRRWPQKGAKVGIDKNVLKEAMYDPGVEYMFKTGMLYIEEMETKVELELEPEGATEPINIIILNDAQKKRYLTVMPAGELREALTKLSNEQRTELVKYAIDTETCDLAHNKILLEATGVDVLNAIRMHQADKEE